jgi:arginine/lysine/ornithine decarboxylase
MMRNFNLSSPEDQEATPYWTALQEMAHKLPTRLQAPSGSCEDPQLVKLLGPTYRYYDLSMVPALEAAQLEAEALAAQAVGAAGCYFMTTGSSGSAKAATTALAAAAYGRGRVAVTGNAHISPMNALGTLGADITVVTPEIVQRFGVTTIVTPAALEAAIAVGNIGGVFYSSPSYNGVLGDLGAVLALCKRHKIPTVVDISWAGEGLFSAELAARSALRLGACVVVCSPHKSQGAPGQASYFFLNHDSLISRWEVEDAVQQERSTSKSSVWLAALDIVRRNAVFNTDRGIQENLRVLGEVLPWLPEGMFVDWKAMGSAIAPGTVPYRITLDTTQLGYRGSELAKHLRDNLGVHVAQGNYNNVVVGVGVGEGETLKRGLVTMARFFKSLPSRRPLDPSSFPPLEMPGGEFDLGTARGRRVPVLLSEAVGRRAGHHVGAYPPGQAALIKGQTITQGHVDYFGAIHRSNGELYGGPKSLMKQGGMLVFA